jgi:hypothetical protein
MNDLHFEVVKSPIVEPAPEPTPIPEPEVKEEPKPTMKPWEIVRPMTKEDPNAYQRGQKYRP